MGAKPRRYLAVLLVAVGMLGSPSASAARASGVTSFRQFMSRLSTAKPTPVTNYVRNYYRGVTVRTSFVSDGISFDCVDVLTQPTAQALHLKELATPPPSARTSLSNPPLSGTDAQGRQTSCPAGTVPIRRPSPEEIAYPTVAQYLRRDKTAIYVNTSGYRYAHAYESGIANRGTISTINIWNPAIPSDAGDHSLSQQWTTGGSGTELQTAEAGWTRDNSFNTRKPIFFTFWTADDYQDTGCYNTSCTGFVQVATTVAPGQVVKPCCSVSGGEDDSYRQEWLKYQGAWWVEYNDTWVGYYPKSIYNGGQMSRHATSIDYGGEVYRASGVWPPMGSGAFPGAGFTYAAYQSGIEYNGTDGNTYLAQHLTPLAASPTCYKIRYRPNTSGEPFFYYGGPGATTC